MRAICWAVLISIGALVIAPGTDLRASGPIAAYAIVDRVTLEPNETTPDRIQVWGVFMLETEPLGSSYSSPQRGYLYYTIPSGNDAKATRAVWADLKKVASTGSVIGFGSGSFSKSGAGRIRKASETPTMPDVFPLGNGVLSMNDFLPIANQLKDFIRVR